MTRKKLISEELGLLFESTADAPESTSPSADGIPLGKHSLLAQGSLLNAFCRKHRAIIPPLASGRARWYVPEQNAGLEELQKATQWFVCIGAELSPQLIRLAASSIVCIFEPDRARMDALIEKLDLPLLARKTLFFFSGDLEYMPEPLLHCIPPDATSFGPPVVFALPGMPENYMETVRQHVEIVYYHYQLYPYEGYAVTDHRRPVQSGYSYPQTRHLIENLGLLSMSGGVEELRGVGAGKTALLVAAGPGLDGQIATIRRLAPHCVIICAAKACAALARHGISPDIVLLMDVRPSCAAELAGLSLKDSILVAYTLAGARAAECGRFLFFGEALEQLGMPDHALDHLGSVINYGFYLSTVMGCAQVLCAGLQLAAPAPRGAGYAEGLMPEGTASALWPCQVRVPGLDKPLHTSLNFLDVALWLRAFIQKHAIPVINLSRESLLFGRGIVYNPDPEPPDGTVSRPLPLPCPASGTETRDLAVEALEKYSHNWGSLSRPELLMSTEGDSLTERFEPLLRTLDGAGVSHLLRSYPGFKAGWFAESFFGENLEKRDKAAAEYLESLRKVGTELKESAAASLKLWRQSGADTSE